MNKAKLILTVASALAIGLSAQAQTDTDLLAETTVTAAQTPAWQVCNETSFSLRLATATTIEGKIQPKGWDKVHAGQCIGIKAQPGTPRFLYAESSPAHRGGVREWKGQMALCTSDEDFKADPNIGCALQDMHMRAYLSVDPGEAITTLVEIEDFGNNAATAGIQRLLKDNGYDITRVDGVAGRRTSRTLNEFLKSRGLASTISTEEQLAALETAAMEGIKDVGLTLCNKSSNSVWAAIGRRRKGNWESRGWWSIEPEGCGQVFTETLISNDVSYYALQEGVLDEDGKRGADRLIRSVSTQPTQFCVSDSRFSVIGRENCGDMGYKPANFRPLPIDKEGVVIELTDADFAHGSVTGLRQ
ncbi:MAG: DUF1036 domain-containing protein [Hellea sp.]|nr:DUF1036 domain-containing protein [Hellea sp.]